MEILIETILKPYLKQLCSIDKTDTITTVALHV